MGFFEASTITAENRAIMLRKWKMYCVNMLQIQNAKLKIQNAKLQLKNQNYGYRWLSSKF
jgi:hypothetical protein